jgi:tRNA threonylcarbamoyladenosine biosynthesis protein TsaB
MTTILAIDSSIGISSACIMQDGKVLAYLENKEPGMQSAQLIPLIENTLKEAKLTYKDLTHIAASTGPGSFTGIRISLSAARAVAFALSIPALGFTTLEVMKQATGEKNVVAILNAGKGEVFFQYFGKHTSEPAIGTIEAALVQAKDHTIASSMKLPAGFKNPNITFPRADALAQLAHSKSDRAAPLEPFYIRPPDAKPQTKLFSAG